MTGISGIINAGTKNAGTNYDGSDSNGFADIAMNIEDVPATSKEKTDKFSGPLYRLLGVLSKWQMANKATFIAVVLHSNHE